MLVYEIFILLLAGLGAGLVTGFIGASAVLIAAPLMIVFLGYDAFTAVGISLAIDIFASAITAYIFYKHDNLNIKPAIIILVFAVIGAYVGSYFSASFPTGLLSKVIGFFTMLTGLNIMKNGLRLKIKPIERALKKNGPLFKAFLLMLAGIIVGLIAGIFGSGGGVSLLLILVFILGYRIHPAIGTSVFIMTFIAISGTIGHIQYGSFLVYPFIIAAIGGIFGAAFSAKVSNLTFELKLQKIVGFTFFVLGLFLFLKEIFYLIY